MAEISGASKSSKKVRCLVIQFARLGDTLQSLMALRAAKQLYPQMEIHFAARERFAAAAKRVPWIHQVITLPTDDLLLPILGGQKSEAQGLGDIARWIAPLVKNPWDYIINWSYSESSSFLTGLLPARVKLGFSRRKDTTFLCSDGWSHYIQAIVQGGVDQNIHLTDILTTQLLTALQIHEGDPTEDGNAPVTSKGFFSIQVSDKDLVHPLKDPSKKWIGIQLGASHPTKAWTPEKWAKLSSMILSRHSECGIVLLGGKEDQTRESLFLAKIKEFGVSSRSIVSLVGKTDFDLWTSVVSRCHWIMSGDTAVVHLASVLGTRVLNVSVGPVRPSETGPYGNGHYVVSSGIPCEGCEKRELEGHHSCQEAIAPEAVYATWSYASNEWAHRRQIPLEHHFTQLGLNSTLGTVRVHRSKIRNTTDGGGVVFEPVLQRAMRTREWSSQVVGHIARAWYCGWTPAIGHELTRGTIDPSLIQTLRQLNDSSQVLMKICEEAKRTATQLSKKSSRLKSERLMPIHDRDELRDLGKKLTELDQLIDRLADAQTPLKAFSQMGKVLMHNLRSDQISDLSKESADCYGQLTQGISLFRDWIKHTLELAKPVAVQGASVISIDLAKPPGKELSP